MLHQQQLNYANICTSVTLHFFLQQVSSPCFTLHLAGMIVPALRNVLLARQYRRIDVFSGG